MAETNGSISGRIRRWRVLALVIAVLAALAGPTGAAYAVALPAAHSSSTGSTGSTVQSRAAADKPAATTAHKPVAPVRQKAPAAPAGSTLKADRAAAAHAAVAQDTGADTCSGEITPDTVHPCAEPTGSETYTVTLTDSTDLLVVRALSTSGSTLPVTVTAPDGSAVSCDSPLWYQAPECATSQSGSYTVQVQDDGSAFSVAYSALLSDSTCTAADPSFGSPVLHGSLAAGSVGDCYTLDLTSGSVLHTALSSDPWQQLSVAVVDADGTQVCNGIQGDCTLTGTAPYRVLASDFYAAADSYYLTLNSVSQPTGCVTAAQLTYGQAADSESAVACRTLTVATADSYQVYPASDQDNGLTGALYNPDGTTACAPDGSATTCALQPGTYDYVVTEYPVDGTMPQFGLVFLAADESRGCTATGDTDFASGQAKGTIAGIAEQVCLTLPTASGKTDYVDDQTTADGSSPLLEVVDATGAQQCGTATDYTYYLTCALTGTAPFRVLLTPSEDKAPYTVLVQRTDSQAGCAAWPQSGFGGSWGAQVTVTPTDNVKCLSIPANQHSAGEMIDYANNANVVDGNVTVYDPAGKPVCEGTSAAFCSYQAGTTYTALVTGVNLTSSDTYKLVRRDVSSTAKCSAPASTTVGGPSTSVILTSDLDTVCYRISAAAADKLWLSARADAPSPAGAVLQVTDPSGNEVCRQWSDSCNVTGSTDYQVIVTALGYSGIAIPAHLDTWKVGTASGWAPQCTAHTLSAGGFGPLTGSLTETSTAYCAVMTVPASANFNIDTVVPAGFGNPAVDLLDTSDWSPSGLGLCNPGGGNCFNQTGAAISGVLLVTPGSTPTPLSYTVQGVCASACAVYPTPTGIMPTGGPAEALDRVVVSGTHLTLGTPLELLGGDLSPGQVMLQPVSVNAAGTQLTAVVPTYGVAPGTYDLALTTVGYSQGTPSPGYLPGAYKVTAAAKQPASGLFTAVTPARVLDTRSGLGAAKAKVGADKAVALKVAGVGGVPAKGVSAVALEVTETGATKAGSLTVYPDGGKRPSASDLSFGSGQTVAHLVVVPVTDGKVDLYNGSSGTVNLLADVAGYYSASGSGLTTVGPERVLDTRSGLGAAKAKVGADKAVALKVAGVGGVPAKGVSAVVLNVTETGASKSGYLVAYPDGKSRPGVSDLNYAAEQTVSNLVVLPVVDGKVDLYNASAGSVNLMADIQGYYAKGGAAFQPVPTVRAMDTRSGLGRAGGAVSPHAAASLDVTSVPGVQLSGEVTAVLMNVTVVSPTAGGYLTAFPEGTPLPGSTNVAFTAKQTVTGTVVVPVVNGRIDFDNDSSAPVQLTVDLQGYFFTS